MLQLTKTAQNGVTVINAIHKVTSVYVDCTGQASYMIVMLVDAASTTPVEAHGHNFTASMGEGDIFDQCYAHALTLPEYADAVVV
jgi:hypothetical protein